MVIATDHFVSPYSPCTEFHFWEATVASRGSREFFRVRFVVKSILFIFHFSSDVLLFWAGSPLCSSGGWGKKRGYEGGVSQIWKLLNHSQ